MSRYGEQDVNKAAATVATKGGGFRTLDYPSSGAVELTSGTTTVYTPATGNRLRLRWLSLSSLSSATECLVTVKFGTQVVYLWALPAPGAFSRTSAREANNADDALTVTLSAPSTVELNYEVEELVP